MPWTCPNPDCAHDVTSDVRTCPSCGLEKDSWTLVPDQTRQMTLPANRKSFVVLRGASDRSQPEGAPIGELEAAKVVPVVSQAVLRQLAKGQRPSDDKLLVVRLFPAREPTPVITLRASPPQDDEREFEFTVERPADLEPNGSVDVPFLVVHGVGEVPAFQGLRVLDLTGVDPSGELVPELEFEALGRQPRELPTRLLSAPPLDCIGFPGGTFGHDDSFPRPEVEHHMLGIIEVLEEHPEVKVGVFAHASAKGSKAYNKKLSDRRARALLALLTHDHDVFSKVAEEESWANTHYKAMLRALGCNPCEIDTAMGPNSATAVRAFQEEFNADVFHPQEFDGAPTRIHGDLDPDGALGPLTKAALREAYVVRVAPLSPPLTLDRIVGPKDLHVSGCSELNALSPDATPGQNRRATLALYPGDEVPQSFPCKAGDVSACPVDSGGHRTCSFYRETVNEPEASNEDTVLFWDSEWQAGHGGQGRVHLSALSSLDDDTELAFTVYRSEGAPPLDEPNSNTRAELPPEGKLLGKATGRVTHGVAHCRYVHPEDEDPFDVTNWLPPPSDHTDEFLDLDPDGEFPSHLTPEAELEQLQIQPPLFRMDASNGRWGVSVTPGVRVARLRFPEADGRWGAGWRPDGESIGFVVRNGLAVPDDGEEWDPRETVVIHVSLDDARLVFGKADE